MVNGKPGLWSMGAIALCIAAAAHAQDSNAVIGPPQLKDFQLEGRRQTPAPAPTPPPAAAAPSPNAGVPGAEAPPVTRSERQAAAPRTGPARTAVAPVAQQPSVDLSTLDQPATADPAATPAPTAPATPAPTPVATDTGTSYWYYAIPAAALALVGLVMVRRRRRVGDEPVAELVPAVAAAPPSRPRPDPIPRPWLELALKAERASFTDSEAELQFELEISNKGGSSARNLRLDVKMFNGGADQQDKEIGTFFRTAGRQSTKLNLPLVEPGVTGVIHGSVSLPRADMRAMQLDQKLLFIPVVAVNALYDWGEGRTGQTSKSYVIGRELQESSEKMGAFRVDQGPRVWRTVGQRPHKLAKRV